MGALLIIGLSAVVTLGPNNTVPIPGARLAAQCGSNGGSSKNNNDVVSTTINFGCQGNSCTNGTTKGYCGSPHNPILDLAFAIIRFLSAGVGVVIVASFIVAGIQYTMSSGEPSATQAAIKRIQSNLTALILFIFGYAILNYFIPGGFLH